MYILLIAAHLLFFWGELSDISPTLMESCSVATTHKVDVFQSQ